MAAAMRTGRARGPRGFAYLVLLVALAVIAVAASSSLSLGSKLARRDAEQELLSLGTEWQLALRSYAGIAPAATAPGVARGPREISDLLKDPRAAAVRRHMRQVRADPLTGRADWGVVRDTAGFITGVYSLAQGQPVKRQGFDPTLQAFDDADNYQQWVFGLPTAPSQRKPVQQ